MNFFRSLSVSPSEKTVCLEDTLTEKPTEDLESGVLSTFGFMTQRNGKRINALFSVAVLWTWFLNFYLSSVCVCVFTYTCTMACMWRSEDNFEICSFYLVEAKTLVSVSVLSRSG